MLRLRRTESPTPVALRSPVLEEVPACSAPPRSEGEAQIAAYLDRVDAGLRDLPSGTRAEMRRELQAHLEASAVAFQELGETPEQAVHSALTRFGTPDQYCRSLHRELTCRARRTNRRAAFLYALWIFGGMALIDVVLGAIFLNVPSVPSPGSPFYALGVAFCIAWLVVDNVWVLLASPFLAGWRVGKEVGPQGLRAAFTASLATCAGLFLAFAILSFLNPDIHLPLRDPSVKGLLLASLRWVAIYHSIRLPVGLMGVWLARQPAHRWRRSRIAR